MVGDSLESDIKGGLENGFHTCLVETGNYKKGDRLGTIRPSLKTPDVYEAVAEIINSRL